MLAHRMLEHHVLLLETALSVADLLASGQTFRDFYLSMNAHSWMISLQYVNAG